MKHAVIGLATLGACALTSQAPAPAAPHPIPLEDLQSSIRVRNFMEASDDRRFADAAQELARNVVVVKWDGEEIVGVSDALTWFHTGFGFNRCFFSNRTDRGHLNDNSIFYGGTTNSDEVDIEYRPVICFRRPAGHPAGLGEQRSVARFVTHRNGPIARIEYLPPPQLPAATED